MGPRDNVVIPTAHGLMIVNRHEALFHFGVSKQLLENGAYEPGEIAFLVDQLKHLPCDAVCLDIGANIGVHTLELARGLPHGVVHAFEAQRVIHQMLMGNVALNSLRNVQGHLCAVGRTAGRLKLPAIDYGRPTSFGSIELGSGRQSEDIGQVPDWDGAGEIVDVITIDSMQFGRADLIKIDVEGMELDVLAGAALTIRRCKPLLLVEHLKTDKRALVQWLRGAGFRVYPGGANYFCLPLGSAIAVHGADEILSA